MFNHELMMEVEKFLDRQYLSEACQLLCSDARHLRSIRVRSMRRSLIVIGESEFPYDFIPPVNAEASADAFELSDLITTTVSIESKAEKPGHYTYSTSQRFKPLTHVRNILGWSVPGALFMPTTLKVLSENPKAMGEYFEKNISDRPSPVLMSERQAAILLGRLKRNIEIPSDGCRCSDKDAVERILQKIQSLYEKQCRELGITPFAFSEDF